MALAVAAAETVRAETSPNPWVGAVLVAGDGTYEAATAPFGGPHAEVTALRLAREAGAATAGSTLYTTLEPCAHVGRTGPCVDAILAGGVARVVVGLIDPDPKVAGKGVAALRAAGVQVDLGVGAAEAAEQLAPYLKHRRTGRPWVVLKLAATLDGRTAAADGSSRWITGEAARHDAHRLRAVSDAVLVGAGTVRADDPRLTVRGIEGARDPLRVVLGRAPRSAAVHPALEVDGDLGSVLDRLGAMDVVQLLVEGGPTVAHAFHSQGLVDRYVLYLAPALSGGGDGRPLFDGPGASAVGELWRGRVVSVVSLGEDLRVELAPDAERRGARGRRVGATGRRRGAAVVAVSEARIPTSAGEWTARVYESPADGEQHLALVKGEVGPDELVRVHSECLTGDVFGSLRCDCGAQLRAALDRIEREGRGVVVYLRGHEGRGVGLGHKILAYRLQEEGRDTVDANVALGLPVDAREYGIGAEILADLGVTTMRLMTNNPRKYAGLDGFGLEITERVPLECLPNPENLSYLRTKRERMGHLLEGLNGAG